MLAPQSLAWSGIYVPIPMETVRRQEKEGTGECIFQPSRLFYPPGALISMGTGIERRPAAKVKALP